MHNVFIFSYQEDADASLSSMQSIVTSVQESLTHGNKMIQRSINFCADQAFKVGVDRGFIYKTCLDSYHVIFYALSKTDGGSSGGNASMPSLDVGGSSYTVARPADIGPLDEAPGTCESCIDKPIPMKD